MKLLGQPIEQGNDDARHIINVARSVAMQNQNWMKLVNNCTLNY